MPEDNPLVGDPVWLPEEGNCIIQEIDEDEDSILVEVLSWGKGHDGEVHELDLWTVVNSWSHRFGGMYYPQGMPDFSGTGKPFDLTVASSIMEVQSGKVMGNGDGFIQSIPS